MDQHVTPPRVLAIVGPTASGKTAAALGVARTRVATRAAPVEVVAIDAFTIYRGMDVGTAKPTAAQRREVPHHLVDVLDPTEDVTVAWFQRTARRVVADLHERGVVPLLVGGSGLYFRAVVDDLEFPPTDPGVRARLEQRWSGRAEAAHAQLSEVDPAGAARIEPANLRRTVRALEVWELTGRAFSSFRVAWDDHRAVWPGLQVAYLEPSTQELRTAIAARAHAMVATGLLEEADALRQRPIGRTARQAIGYAEAFAALEAADQGIPIDRDALAERIAVRTWHYARRQRTWFRRDPRCVRSDPLTVRTAFGS